MFDEHDYNRNPTGLLDKVRWTLVICRPLTLTSRILAYFGIYIGPQ